MISLKRKNFIPEGGYLDHYLEMYCVKGGFTTQIHIGWRFICGRMTEAEKAVIDQQERSEAGASGDGLGAPFSLPALCESS